MIIIAIFTDKTTDKIQIPLIYLDCPFGIRLCPLLIFFFQNHLLNIHSGCQYARYCYSYDKNQAGGSELKSFKVTQSTMDPQNSA